MYKKHLVMFDQINLTPLTDVFLVLLVVLMLLTPLMDRSILKMADTGGHNCGKSELNQITVDVDPSGKIVIDGENMRFTDSLFLQKQLARIKGKSSKECSVLIRSKELSKHGDVVAVMDAACGAGIAQVGIQPPEN